MRFLIEQLISDWIMLPPASSLSSNQDKSTPTKQQTIIYIEYCSNCGSHLSIVKHQEQKYHSHYETVKNYLSQKGFMVRKRPVPVQLVKQSPYCPLNMFYNKQGEMVYYPGIGSFEVFLGEQLIFSKLNTNKWPKPQQLLQAVKNAPEVKPQVKQIQNNALNQPLQYKSEAPSFRANLKDDSSKSHHSKWYQGDNNNQRYSLHRGNLLNKSESKQMKSVRMNYRSIQKRHFQEKQMKIINMYSPHHKKQPIYHNPVKAELDSSLPQNKTRVANVYLQPICPKTNVSFENYQKHRTMYAKKIHEQKIAYDIQKSRREAEALLFPPALKQKRFIHKVSNQIITMKKSKQERQEQPKLKVVKEEGVQDNNQKYKGQKNKDQKNKEEKEENGKNRINSLTLPKEKKEEEQWNEYQKSISREKKEESGHEGDGKEEEIVKLEEEKGRVASRKSQKIQNIQPQQQHYQAKTKEIPTTKMNRQQVNDDNYEDHFEMQDIKDKQELKQEKKAVLPQKQPQELKQQQKSQQKGLSEKKSQHKIEQGLDEKENAVQKQQQHLPIQSLNVIEKNSEHNLNDVVEGAEKIPHTNQHNYQNEQFDGEEQNHKKVELQSEPEES